MNMPRIEFLCGMPQELEIDWRFDYRHRIYIFERHREHEPMRDLAFLVARWLRKKQHLPPVNGYVHTVEFPEDPAMEMLAWTAHRAFHLREPNDRQPAPAKLLLFMNRAQLLEWKRRYWTEQRISSRVGYDIHRCYDPDGQRMQERCLLTFTNNG